MELKLAALDASATSLCNSTEISLTVRKLPSISHGTLSISILGKCINGCCNYEMKLVFINRVHYEKPVDFHAFMNNLRLQNYTES